MIESIDLRMTRISLNHGAAHMPALGVGALIPEASLERLGLNFLYLYLIHTPFAFQPGDEQDPRDQNGNVLYDHNVTLLDTWKAMENLVDHGKCRANRIQTRQRWNAVASTGVPGFVPRG